MHWHEEREQLRGMTPAHASLASGMRLLFLARALYAICVLQSSKSQCEFMQSARAANAVAACRYLTARGVLWRFLTAGRRRGRFLPEARAAKAASASGPGVKSE